MDEIVNKVAQSGIITIDPEEFIPKGKHLNIDLKEILWQGLVLRENDLKNFIETHPWENYKDTFVSIYCSEDAVIPHWAYMKLAISLQPFAKTVFYGTKEQMEEELALSEIAKMYVSPFENQRVVIKGCGNKNFTSRIYVALTNKLESVVKSLMFGEPCSTVPIFKKNKDANS